MNQQLEAQSAVSDGYWRAIVDQVVSSRVTSRFGKPVVQMRFSPEWDYIDGVRSFCKFFCETTFQRAELAERAQLVLQEALENAVKYSSAGELNELELEISSADEQLEIAVTSRPDPAHLSTLRSELEQLKAFDPEAAYILAFQRASREPEKSARLGLARMRYEGRFELRVEELSGGRARLCAQGPM